MSNEHQNPSRPPGSRRQRSGGGRTSDPLQLTREDARLALGTHRVLATLPPIQAEILRLRFGIPDYSERLEALEHFALTRVETRHAVEEARTLTPELLDHLRKHGRDLEKLPWDVFEHLIAEFLASWGYRDVRLVGRDTTTQADVVAVHEIQPAGIRLRYFVEVKRTREQVGIEIINQVYGAFAFEQPKYGWTVAMIVSLAGFKKVKRFSHGQFGTRNLHLKDGSDVVKWLQDYRFGPNGLWLPNPKRRLGLSEPTEGPPNKPVQPTRAAKPIGKRARRVDGPRG